MRFVVFLAFGKFRSGEIVIRLPAISILELRILESSGN
jgi:hypothetical protein